MAANIYVSATYVDLRAHRKAACDAIRVLGHTDLAMEYYVAEAQRPLARCLADVERCDLFIGLFARRYGFVPAGSRRSITEQEFNAAVKHRKDVLCFFLADHVRWPLEFVDRGTAARRLSALRRKISGRYVVSTFSTPDELAAKVSQSVSKALTLAATPIDPERESRLVREWRDGPTTLVRTRARSALLHMGSPRYAAIVKDLLLQATERLGRGEASARRLAVEEIASYFDELLTLAVTSRQCMPILLELLRSADDRIRVLSIFNIGELGLRGKEISSDIVQQLMELESDPSAASRAELAHTLGKIHHFSDVLPDVKSCLKRMMEESDERVRERATGSLKRL
jgi:hypothetical protein